jgi:hypothetical protein
MVAASGSEPPRDQARFDELYKLALAVFTERGHPMPAALQERVLRIHRLRNLAVHLGAEPASRMVQSALRTAGELRALAIDTLEALEAFRESGPVQAVATLVSVESISVPLAEAERLLGEDKVSEAADQASIALYATLERVSPRLRSTHYRRPSSLMMGRETSREVTDAVIGLNDRANRLESWILASALGLRPRELRHLQQMLGEPVYTMGGPQPRRIDRDEGIELSRTTVESALLTTADVVYRLWQDDSLILSDEPWRED